MNKEYIDRNDLIKNLNYFAPEHYSALIHNLIMKQPTVDVAEVIRCKDCRYKNPYGNSPRHKCFWDNIRHDDNDYCSNGRRVGDDND